MGHRRIKEKEKAQIIYGLRREYKIVELIKIAGMSRSTYYYHVGNMGKPDKYEKTKEAIRTIFHKHKGRYGYRRVLIELRRKGYALNHKTVQRIMHEELGLYSMVRLKRYYSYTGDKGKIAPNILSRDFTAQKPNEKWATDVTEFALLGQKLYLSPIIDLYNGEIVSYSLSERPDYAQIQEMLNKAFEKHSSLKNLILHSDQGWQYQLQRYQTSLREKGIIQSMSRKGNCLDNSVMENFFGHLKSELFYLQDFESIEQFKEELDAYMDYYNNQRIKLKYGMSPIEYREKKTS